MPLRSFGKKHASHTADVRHQGPSVHEAGTSQAGQASTNGHAAELVSRKLSRDRRQTMLALDIILTKSHKLVARAEKHPEAVLSAEKVGDELELTVGRTSWWPQSKQKQKQEQSRATVLAALLADYDSAMMAAGIENSGRVGLGSDARLTPLTDPTLDDVPITGEEFLEIAQAFGEMLVKNVYQSLPPSHAEREAVRAPSDCLMHWISALTDAHARHSSTLLETQINLAQQIWVRHQITRGIVKQFINSSAIAVLQDGHHELTPLADALNESMAEIADPVPRPVSHENIYGRAFESFMSNNLVNAPPSSALKAMETVGKSLEEMLDKGIKQAAHISLETAEAVREDQRFWFPKVPRMKEFSEATNRDDALKLLRIFLNAPVKTGYDCIAMPYLATKLALRAFIYIPNHMPWMYDANANYKSVVLPAATRLKNAKIGRAPHAGPDAGLSRDGSLSMWHQPSANKKPWMTDSVKPVSIYRPNFEPGKLSEEAVCQLANGVPFAGGTSGTTNLLLHLFHAIAITSATGFDKKAAFLATMMFVNYDGGHSFHESLWVANQMNFMPMPPSAHQSRDYRKFVADYAATSSYFEDDAAIAWERAIEAAWPETVAYFREHSHYSDG